MPETGADRRLQDRRLRDGLGEVGRVFFNFPSLSEVQRAAIPPVAAGENVLVCAPTATGKTEAVIAPMVWRLRRRAGGSAPGPRLLAVAPTRALVADLVSRLEAPLAELGWRCAAQTSDFRGARVEPEVLVTTPESFDSMLVRCVRIESGRTAGHLLAGVAAVFVDEAHCFDATARGDQLVFLLARLRKLRESAQAKGWVPTADLHVCAASATVPAPEDLAKRLLGSRARVVACPGSRPIEILTRERTWFPVEPGTAAPELVARLPITNDHKRIAELLWAALEGGSCRKALLFVPSRRQCDLLGRRLRTFPETRRFIWVGTHHGSLSRDHRLDAERSFHAHRDAVLVATNTLEVGVDIGNVDVVALVGAPPDTASLLQRIGRGGRRAGLTRVLPIARHPVEAAAMASQLAAAASGRLELRARYRRWDVWPQQVISYIRQNQGRGRGPDSLLELAAAAWPAADTRTVAGAHLRAWVNEGLLAERRNRLHLAGDWERYERGDEADARVHSNIATSGGVAVRLEATGEVIAHIAGLGEATDTLTLAGRRHRILREDGCLVVAPVDDRGDDETDDTPQYIGRRRQVSEAFAAHVRQGCGLGEWEAPVVEVANGQLWFHFGGEAYERLLQELMPGVVGGSVVAGVALRLTRPLEGSEWADWKPSRVKRVVEQETQRLLADESLSPFARHLPPEGMKALCGDLDLAGRFLRWLTSRRVTGPRPLSHYPALARILGGPP